MGTRAHLAPSLLPAGLRPALAGGARHRLDAPGGRALRLPARPEACAPSIRRSHAAHPRPHRGRQRHRRAAGRASSSATRPCPTRPSASSTTTWASRARSSTGSRSSGTVDDLPHVARLKGARMVLILHPTEPTNGEVARGGGAAAARPASTYRVLPAARPPAERDGASPGAGWPTASGRRPPDRRSRTANGTAAPSPTATAHPRCITRGRTGPRHRRRRLRRLVARPQAAGPRLPRARARQLPLRGPRARRDRRPSAPGDHRGRHPPPGQRGARGQGCRRRHRPRRPRRRRRLRPRSRGDGGHQLRVRPAPRRRLPASRGCPRFVFASSCSVYGANSELVLNEGSWLNPVSLYARTRIQSEEMLLQHSESPGRGHPPAGHGVRALAADALRPDRQHPHHARHPQREDAGLRRQPVAAATCTSRTPPRPSSSAWRRPRTKVEKGVFNVGANENNHTILEIAKMVQRQLPQAALEIKGDVTGSPRLPRLLRQDPAASSASSPASRVEDGIREIAEALTGGPDHRAPRRGLPQLSPSQTARAPARAGANGASSPSGAPAIPSRA